MSTTPAEPLAAYRAAYAKEVAGDQDPRVVAAFAAVPREVFLGPPPWWTGSGGGGRWHETGAVGDLYQDILVSLDRGKGINNGQPSLHARCIAALGLTKTDHVLHVGAGTGYYTAILAELAGSVVGYEIEPRLAAAATANLAPWPNARIRHENATGRALPEADALYVSAGASHPDPSWLDALRPGGRLLFPLTGGGVRSGAGGMLLVRRPATPPPPAYAARFLDRVSFIACAGARDDAEAARLAAVFAEGGEDTVRSLWRGTPDGASVWFAGDGWSLSTEPVPQPDA